MSAVLVTGAASGIGKAICSEFSKNNVPFVAIDRDERRLRELFPEDSIVCDLTSSNDIEAVFSTLYEKGIIIKGIIHCAGICKIQDIKDITEKDMLMTYHVNVFSLIEMFKHLLSYKKRELDSRIIALSSITANRAYKNQLLYASSKAALENLILGMAQEGIEQDIKVNVVELGAVKTEMFDSLSPNMQTISRHYPLGLLNPHEAAEIIIDLLKPAYGKTTGSIFRIDSGFTVVH